MRAHKGASRGETGVRRDLRIGETLLALRRERSLSQQKLARRAGISASLVSQIEHDAITPSVETLCRLAEALSVRVGAFFVEAPSDSVLVRKAERGRFRHKSGGYRYEVLASCSRANALASVRVIFGPGGEAAHDAFARSGLHFAYVEAGRIEFTMDGMIRELGEGDSLCFRAERAHSWRNPYPEEAELLWVLIDRL